MGPFELLALVFLTLALINLVLATEKYIIPLVMTIFFLFVICVTLGYCKL